MNLSQSFLLNLYLFIKINITGQVYLYNCTYKVEDKGMIDCLGGNPFETDEDEVDD